MRWIGLCLLLSFGGLMINKIKLFIMLFLTILTSYFYFRYYLAQNEITALKNENSTLKSDIIKLENAVEVQKEEVKKYNDSQIQASRQIAELREAAKNIKKDCNCYNKPIDSSIIKLLPKP